MFKQRLAAEVSLRVRTKQELACVVVDVDDFQAINDVQGHPFGDRVLQAVGTAIKSVCRAEDVPCRLGGDAFVIVTPNTDPQQALLLADRMDAALKKIQLNSRGLPVSINFSVAVAPAIGIYDRAMHERGKEAIDQARTHGEKGVTLAAAQVSEGELIPT